MYILFDQAGKFLTGRILSQTDTSAQVELDTGKRVKVKARNQLLHFDAPAPAALVADAEAQAAEVDPALAWEFAPDEEFGFAELAADYFGDAPSVTQQVAALFALHEVPHYFRRAGKGRFRKAPADLVDKALAAIARKEEEAAQVNAWAEQLQAGHCPQVVLEHLYKILFKPDKNRPEYKAVAQAAHASGLSPLTLLVQAGAIASAYEFHWQRFLFENFPEGTAFPAGLPVPVLPDGLPLAEAQAISIDDADTTEIDDAVSVAGLGSGTVTLGVHIAAPGLAIAPGDALDAVARERLSTVYMPGRKLTMLPQAVVDRCALQAGHAVPAVSLYVQVDEQTLELQGSQTRLERVHTAANLRHDDLQWLFDDHAERQPEAAIWQPQLAFLHRLALALKAAREQVRGKPENYSRPDYAFKLLDQQGEQPTGEEQVQITQRRRGEPLDLIVSELMVLANCSWGEWLKQLGVAGIYRSQAALAPGVKVRMSTRALPHAGIGVPSYCWSTSPLRRYVDLVNQWQIIAAAQHGNTAALAAPFKPKDTNLLAIISAFDSAYTAYAQNQRAMERYWTLRHLQQNHIGELTARLMREQPDGHWLARAENLPLVLSVPGTETLAPGRRVLIQLGAPDLVALDVSGSVARVLADAAPGTSHEAHDAEDPSDDDTGAIAIRMDTDDSEAEQARTP